jgi:hypothetical protein
MIELNTALAFASFALSAAKDFNDYDESIIARQNEFAYTQRQAALNNQLAYNGYLNLNEQEQMEFKRNSLDQFELQRKIRRAVAYRLAIQGNAQKSGGSAESVLRNIERQGLYSLHRKDLNYELRLRNLQLQRNNIALEVQSKNNALYGQLQGFPSATGLALSIGGTALQKGMDWQKGRKTGKLADKGPPKTTSIPANREGSTSGWKVEPDGSYSVSPWNP